MHLPTYTCICRIALYIYQTSSSSSFLLLIHLFLHNLQAYFFDNYEVELMIYEINFHSLVNYVIDSITFDLLGDNSFVSNLRRIPT